MNQEEKTKEDAIKLVSEIEALLDTILEKGNQLYKYKLKINDTDVDIEDVVFLQMKRELKSAKEMFNLRNNLLKHRLSKGDDIILRDIPPSTKRRNYY